ncbi:MAG TPA: hypothetical protein VGG32_06135 [Thermoplasmata archaeon]|jgi:hypothetical protein
MREGISNNPSGSSSRIVWSGATLVAIGLSVLLLAGEWFAAFDACVANPTCNAEASPSTLEVYLALMMVGVALAVVGITIALTRGRGLPRRAMILWL